MYSYRSLYVCSNFESQIESSYALRNFFYRHMLYTTQRPSCDGILLASVLDFESIFSNATHYSRCQRSHHARNGLFSSSGELVQDLLPRIKARIHYSSRQFPFLLSIFN